MSSSMSQDVPSLTSMPRASKDVEKHCPIRAMNVATHLKKVINLFKTFTQGWQKREPGIETTSFPGSTQVLFLLREDPGDEVGIESEDTRSTEVQRARGRSFF